MAADDRNTERILHAKFQSFLVDVGFGVCHCRFSDFRRADGGTGAR
jgi:hypothetical protein